MGQLNRVIATGALLCACSSSAPTASGGTPRAIPRAKAALSAPESDPRLDEQGLLRPGSLKIGWFPIPIGFERIPGSTDRSGNFEASSVTVEQLRSYVDAHGQPRQVETLAHGEIYRQVTPSHTQLPVPPVDVTVLIVDSRSKRLRLVVDDRTPTEAALSPQQAMEKLAKARDRTE